MGKFLKENDTLCPICEAKSETEDHLFFECEAAQAVWFSSNLGLRLKHYNKSCKEWITEWIKPLENRTVITQGATIMWIIWKARNKFLFEHQLVSAGEIMEKAIQMTKDYLPDPNSQGEQVSVDQDHNQPRK